YREQHPPVPSEDNSLLTPEGEKALFFSACKTKPVGNPPPPGRALFFKILDGSVRRHTPPHSTLTKGFRVLGNHDQAQIALASAPGKIGQELASLRVFDQRGSFINKECPAHRALINRLRPDAIGNQEDANGTQIAAHIPHIPDEQVGIKLNIRLL